MSLTTYLNNTTVVGGGGGGSNPSYGNIVLPSTAYGNNDSHEDGSKFFVTHSSNNKYYVETLNGGLKVSEGDIVGKADGKYYHIYNHELEREQLGAANNANGSTWEYFLVSGVTGNSDWGLVWNSANCFLNQDVSPPVVLQYEPLTTDGFTSTGVEVIFQGRSGSQYVMGTFRKVQ
jgi:hypothetical protein